MTDAAGTASAAPTATASASSTADLNGDGLIDLYVANDMNPNFLFLNKGDGTFEDATESSGAAFDEKGQAQSGMGVDAEDVDGDGLPELFVTNFAERVQHALPEPRQGQRSSTRRAILRPGRRHRCRGSAGAAPWPTSTTTAGPTASSPTATSTTTAEQLGQTARLSASRRCSSATCDRASRFQLATRDAGPYFAAKHVGRGAAFGDLDNDGDIDIVVNHKDGPPAVLRNDTPGATTGSASSCRAPGATATPIGARVEVEAGGPDDRPPGARGDAASSRRTTRAC